MAVIPYPARLRRTSWDMQVDPFALERHESEFTGEESVVIRGAGRWRGTCTFALVDSGDRATAPDLAAEVSAWLGDLVAGHTTRIPLPAGSPTLAAGTSRPVTGISATGDLQFTTAATVRNGDLIRVGDRIYRVRQPALGAGTATTSLTVVPYGVGLRRSRVIGQNIVPADTILVRAVEATPDPSTVEFSGPWVLRWVESSP